MMGLCRVQAAPLHQRWPDCEVLFTLPASECTVARSGTRFLGEGAVSVQAHALEATVVDSGGETDDDSDLAFDLEMQLEVPHHLNFERV